MTKKLNASPDQIVEAICSVAFAKGASSSLRENIIEALSTLPTVDDGEASPPSTDALVERIVRAVERELHVVGRVINLHTAIRTALHEGGEG